MIEETKTLEEVLYDVKAKYDAAQQGQIESQQKVVFSFNFAAIQ